MHLLFPWKFHYSRAFNVAGFNTNASNGNLLNKDLTKSSSKAFREFTAQNFAVYDLMQKTLEHREKSGNVICLKDSRHPQIPWEQSKIYNKQQKFPLQRWNAKLNWKSSREVNWNAARKTSGNLPRLLEKSIIFPTDNTRALVFFWHRAQVANSKFNKTIIPIV